MTKPEKGVVWMGNTLKNLRSFPDEVKQVFGTAIYYAQRGGKHPQSLPMKGIATPQADIDVINSRLRDVKKLEGVKS